MAGETVVMDFSGILTPKAVLSGISGETFCQSLWEEMENIAF